MINKEKTKNYQKKYRAKNKERLLAYNRVRKLKKKIEQQKEMINKMREKLNWEKI